MTIYGAKSRQPLKLNGKVVEHGTTRRLKDGSLVYEFTAPRAIGQPKPGPRVMKGITTATDAKHEIERLLPLMRDGEIGDRTAKLEPTYRACLAAMESGEFTHSKGPYTPRSIELFKQKMTDKERGVLVSLGRSTVVAEIKTAHLRAYQTRLKSKGISGSTIRGYMSCASCLLRYAVQQEIRDSNPANNFGRGERVSSERRSEPRYLSIREVNLLLAKVTNKTSQAVVASLFWGCLRVSEALELRWSDIQGDELLVRGTKTKASWALIPLLPQLAAVLAEERTRSGKLGFDRIQPDALIFQTRNGTPLGRRNILRSVYEAGDAARLNEGKDAEGKGLERIGCHDLRHSMVAEALKFLTVAEASRLARHANAQVTLTMYAGASDATVKGIGAKLVAGLGG